MTGVTRLSRLGLSRIGLGTAGLAGLYRSTSAEAAAELVHRALDSGVTYLDTAPLYGYGVAERRLGEALHGRPRSSYVLSTKVGRVIVPDRHQPDARAAGHTGRFDRVADDDIFADAPTTAGAYFDFSRDAVLRSLEGSLSRLGVDRVDVVYLHDPEELETQALSQGYPAVEELRAQGVVSAIGAGVNTVATPLRFVRETDVDVVLLAGRYTLLDPSAADELLPEARARGVGIVAGGVYNSGILADPEATTARYDYAAAPPETVDRARRLAEVCARHDVPLRAAAMQFVAAHPAVVSVLTGAGNVSELVDNIAMSRHPIPDRLWSDLVGSGLLPESLRGQLPRAEVDR